MILSTNYDVIMLIQAWCNCAMIPSIRLVANLPRRRQILEMTIRRHVLGPADAVRPALWLGRAGIRRNHSMQLWIDLLSPIKCWLFSIAKLPEGIGFTWFYHVNGGVTIKMQFLLPSEMILCAIKNVCFCFFNLKTVFFSINKWIGNNINWRSIKIHGSTSGNCG